MDSVYYVNLFNNSFGIPTILNISLVIRTISSQYWQKKANLIKLKSLKSKTECDRSVVRNTNYSSNWQIFSFFWKWLISSIGNKQSKLKFKLLYFF
jgi:hypothetical protein